MICQVSSFDGYIWKKNGALQLSYWSVGHVPRNQWSGNSNPDLSACTLSIFYCSRSSPGLNLKGLVALPFLSVTTMSDITRTHGYPAAFN